MWVRGTNLTVQMHGTTADDTQVVITGHGEGLTSTSESKLFVYDRDTCLFVPPPGEVEYSIEAGPFGYEQRWLFVDRHHVMCMRHGEHRWSLWFYDGAQITLNRGSWEFVSDGDNLVRYNLNV